MVEREGPVGVRLPADVKAALEREAEGNHRSLHGEIVARLAASVRPITSRRDAFAGLLSQLDERLAVVGARHEDADTLALLRIAFAALLDQMGAAGANLTEDQATVASAVGRQLARDFLMTVVAAHPNDPVFTSVAEAIRDAKFKRAEGETYASDAKPKSSPPRTGKRRQIV